jgi:hypothetical protein
MRSILVYERGGGRERRIVYFLLPVRANGQHLGTLNKTHSRSFALKTQFRFFTIDPFLQRSLSPETPTLSIYATSLCLCESNLSIGYLGGMIASHLHELLLRGRTNNALEVVSRMLLSQSADVDGRKRYVLVLLLS